MSMSKRNAARIDSGFTLLEVLVCLALIAPIIAMIAAGITSTRLTIGAADRLNERSTVPMAQDYLRSALIQAQTFSSSRSATDQDLTLTGDESSLSFITAYSSQAQVKGLYRVSVSVVPSPKGVGLKNLIVNQSLFRPAIPGAKEQPQATASATLISGIKNATFAYFGEASGFEGSGWLANWLQRDDFPSLVRIDVVFPKGDERQWPTLKAPLSSPELPM